MVLKSEDVWKKVLDIIKEEIQPMSFNTWFKDPKIYKIDDTSVVIRVPMTAHLTMFTSNYNELLNNAFSQATGKDLEISCILESDIEEKEENLVESVVDKSEVIDNKPNYKHESNLNKKYTFENFVQGDTNKFAKTSAMAVAQAPGAGFNPLFIYGKSGLGKTHLMHAIGNFIEEHSDLKVLYAPCDEFLKDYSVFSNPTENRLSYAEDFNEKYRNIDVLIVDDIQHLVGAARTQVEFFNIFNYLQSKNKQIILSSDRSPDDLKSLEDRLSSRFAMGLPVDIYPPDFELNCRIIREKIKNLNINEKMTEEAIEFIANNCGTNVRILEGAINRIVIHTAMNVPDKIDLDFTNIALKDYLNKNPYDETDIMSIQTAVASYYNITVEVLKGKKRSANIAYPRMVAMYLCRNLTDQSFPRIGLEFGGRDHSTVIHACDKIEEDIKNNAEIKEIINQIKSKL